jgi:hypothetical protein
MRFPQNALVWWFLPEFPDTFWPVSLLWLNNFHRGEKAMSKLGVWGRSFFGFVGFCWAAFALSASSQASVAYLSSQTGPAWGSPDSKNAMDAAFGSGNWQDLVFETAVPAAVFSKANRFVFMDGGDTMTAELDAFMSANRATIESWVQGGGNLFVNAASNEQDSIDYGFGGVSVVDAFSWYSDFARAVDPTHAIFTGPLPTSDGFVGYSFSHGYLVGPGISPLIIGFQFFDPADLRPVLAKKAFGNGFVLFGSMTVPGFHDPNSEAFNLLANTLSYTNSLPEPSTMVVFGIGALVAGIRSRKSRK